MIKVLEIKPKTKTTYEIYIEDKDQKDCLIVHQETVIKYRLMQHSSFDQTTWKSLQTDDRFHHAYAFALSKLSYKMYTPKKIAEAMQKAAISKGIQKRVIEALKAAKYIDEAKALKMLVEDFIEFEDKGPQLLKQKLQKEGYQASLIEQALKAYTDTIEASKCKKYLEKTVPSMQNIPRAAQQQKLFQKAYQRGFSRPVIEATIDEVMRQQKFVDEFILIDRVIEKYLRRYNVSDYKEKQKCIAALLRQGYTYETIKNAIEKRESDEEV